MTGSSIKQRIYVPQLQFSISKGQNPFPLIKCTIRLCLFHADVIHGRSYSSYNSRLFCSKPTLFIPMTTFQSLILFISMELKVRSVVVSNWTIKIIKNRSIIKMSTNSDISYSLRPKLIVQIDRNSTEYYVYYKF